MSSQATDAWSRTWELLFSTPIHLDSALASLPRATKPLIARRLPVFLRKPLSVARSLGIGVPQSEPWALRDHDLARWPVAARVGERVVALTDAAWERIEALDATGEDYPPEMLREWESEWGTDAAPSLARALGAQPPLDIRLDRRKDGRAYAGELAALGGQLSADANSVLPPSCVRFGGYTAVMKSAAFKFGLAEIQDAGSQVLSLVAALEDPELARSWLQSAPTAAPIGHAWPQAARLSGSARIVDACAGAGGKTLAIADELGGKARVFAYDISATKLRALRGRAERHELRNIQTSVVSEDDYVVAPKFVASADRVLVDAPCSGWGVLRRNPDIKWKENWLSLSALQMQLLSRYAPLVRPGGWLFYSVCTFRKTETRGVVEGWRESAAALGLRLAWDGFLGPEHMDGFYLAAFRAEGTT